MKTRSFLGIVTLALGLLTQVPSADAFCGFYVGGAGTKLYNDATVVVMMREGTRTVLSMQNAYKGPPEKFAMVVPVPVVLQEENVKTLPSELFDKVDQLASPRLVEYWEQDPCPLPTPPQVAMPAPQAAQPVMAAKPSARAAADLGVTVEAQFAVGEYQIVILSAKDSGGLEKWLHQEQYSIPEGAAPYFKPYITAGSKFFVARVDITKVKMADGMALLSPLRFHYDSETFTLPVRLGLINSSGTQDLLVHILARGKRYEVANYPNVTIPTNLDVSEGARDSFSTFYTSLLDRTIEKNPKAVVTEYSWDSGSCDPCPGPALGANDVATLGGDVIDKQEPTKPAHPTPVPGGKAAPTSPPNCAPPFTFDANGVKHYTLECIDVGVPPSPPPSRRSSFNGGNGGFTLTRLHARYTKEALGEDLVFREAKPIVGGREIPSATGQLETGATTTVGGTNNFQARYAVRHPWTGPISCKEPRRGVWGGPPSGVAPPPPRGATKLGLAPRTGTDVATFLRSSAPEIGVSGAAAPAAVDASIAPTSAADAGMPATPDGTRRGCAGCAVMTRAPAADLAALLASAAAVLALVSRSRRRR
jgi:hypothetical protein